MNTIEPLLGLLFEVVNLGINTSSELLLFVTPTESSVQLKPDGIALLKVHLVFTHEDIKAEWTTNGLLVRIPALKVGEEAARNRFEKILASFK